MQGVKRSQGGFEKARVRNLVGRDRYKLLTEGGKKEMRGRKN